MGGSLHRTGSLPDLRSIADMSLKKVSHVSKNESEAESEPGAKIGYKFKPLPPIPGTSSNINNTGLYETIDGLSKLSKNAVTKTESIESNKRKTFKEIATILTLVPRLTTNSVRSRKNDHRLAEISNYLPDKKLKIFVGTWNMKGTKFLPSSLDDFLLPPESIYLQDVYVIGTQEGTPFRREWQVRLQETFGPSHVLMQSSNFGVLQLSIFVRRELVWFCSSVEQDTIATRVGHKIKTKGALAMSFSIFGTSLCFITSHFTSDKEKLSQRINDYRTINRGIRLPVIPGTKNYENSDVTDRFDRVFWFGDFNFRIQKSRESVDRIMKRHARDQPLIIRELLTHDQLNEVFDRGKIFHGFKENEITFMPTYKFDVNTDVYDSSPKKRVPSWTDRIVYKSPQLSLLKCLYYNSCNTIKVSDHRPVYGIFESEVEPYKNNFQVHGATFDREVYVEANLRRNAPSGSQANSHVCTIL
ncbi:phosphatidylinositol polyphosphate 5-phosphatase type IV-like [Clytia hemisphaerica]|uniref:Inositol polyphosphate-related phosphatase domain-containing protein n=2 Tax=Clytia hemisphaerica TaxID=252671 RepID=A0A7M5V4U5_9CNID